MSVGSIISLIFAVLLAIYAIVSMARKKICIIFSSKTSSGRRSWLKCWEGNAAIVVGIIVLIIAVVIALRGFGVF